MASFAQQYGIRLYQEYDCISCEEFRQLLVGLNGDTPLGYAVQIRSEKNPKKIQDMTKKEKQIRIEWQEFRRKQNKENRIYLSGKELSSFLSKTFK